MIKDKRWDASYRCRYNFYKVAVKNEGNEEEDSFGNKWETLREVVKELKINCEVTIDSILMQDYVQLKVKLKNMISISGKRQIFPIFRLDGLLFWHLPVGVLAD